MPVFRVKMVVSVGKSPTGGIETREIVTKFAGCRDAADAKQKARAAYPHLIGFKREPELVDD